MKRAVTATEKAVRRTRRTVWATGFTVWATEKPVALTVKPLLDTNKGAADGPLSLSAMQRYNENRRNANPCSQGLTNASNRRFAWICGLGRREAALLVVPYPLTWHGGVSK